MTGSITTETPVGDAHEVEPGSILRVGPLQPELTDILVNSYAAPALPTDSERDEFLRQNGSRVRVIVTSGRTGVDADMMAAMPNLEAIVNFGVGYDATDVDRAAELGIGLSNTPEVLDDCVADTAVGLVIDTLRQFSAADRYLRAGRWESDGNYPLTRKVSGSRVGILGLGRIGSAIAKRLAAFDCDISYHNRRPVDGSSYRYVDSATGLAESVDVLVVAAAGGPGTRHLVDRAVLDALGPEGFLINVSRGSVVDEEELIDVLRTGALAGAGLDVFAHEPSVPTALIELNNVVLLPHVASGTNETRTAMRELTLRNLDEFLATGRLVTPVIEPRGRRS